MLWTSFVALLSIWCLALAMSITLNGYIHLLPLIAALIAGIGTLQRGQLVWLPPE